MTVKKIEKMTVFYSLPKKQQKAVAWLFSGDINQNQIANELNVTAATISIWKSKDRFKMAQDEYNRFMFEDLTSSAVKTMSGLLSAKSEMVRYNAASYILDKTMNERKLIDAQIRKANAEADIAHAKANELQGTTEAISMADDWKKSLSDAIKKRSESNGH